MLMEAHWHQKIAWKVAVMVQKMNKVASTESELGVDQYSTTRQSRWFKSGGWSVVRLSQEVSRNGGGSDG